MLARIARLQLVREARAALRRAALLAANAKLRQAVAHREQAQHALADLHRNAAQTRAALVDGHVSLALLPNHLAYLDRLQSRADSLATALAEADAAVASATDAVALCRSEVRRAQKRLESLDELQRVWRMAARRAERRRIETDIEMRSSVRGAAR